MPPRSHGRPPARVRPADDALLGVSRAGRRLRLARARRRRTLAVCGRFFAAIDILVRTLEARDAYTCGHSLRVRRYCLLLAEARALGPRERWQIGLAAKLHDIGKVGIPESVLNKPGPLTDEERRLVQRHPVLGEQILAPMVRSRAVLAAVRGHHERLDGGGYPDGLAGASISRAARVLAIGDCFDALTSARAYRAALPPSQALDVLRAGAGSQFDPGLVETFAQVVCRLPAPRPVRVTA